MLRTRSVLSPIEPGDGLRLLVTRFRGLPTDRYDAWVASLGPSERLLKSFLAGKVTWSQFTKKYREELFARLQPTPPTPRSRTTARSSRCGSLRNSRERGTSRSSATAPTTPHNVCHRFLLRDLIERETGSPGDFAKI